MTSDRHAPDHTRRPHDPGFDHDVGRRSSWSAGSVIPPLLTVSSTPSLTERPLTVACDVLVAALLIVRSTTAPPHK